MYVCMYMHIYIKMVRSDQAIDAAKPQVEKIFGSARARLTACVPACLSACLPASLPASLPAGLSACLPFCLPASQLLLPACLSASLNLKFHIPCLIFYVPHLIIFYTPHLILYFTPQKLYVPFRMSSGRGFNSTIHYTLGQLGKGSADQVSTALQARF